MYKLVLVFLVAVASFALYAVQMDEEAAVRVFFQLKQAVNRAAHAAAQQIDLKSLAEGFIIYDEDAARQEAERYLRLNLKLDERLMAEDDSYLKGAVAVRELVLIDDTHTFPYHYENAQYDYDVTLHKPGVILIIEAEYDRMFQAIGPIIWQVKGAAEIVR